MIDPLTIGAGLTLFALGAGGTWAVMRVRLAELQTDSAGRKPLILNMAGDGRLFHADVQGMLDQIRYHAACHSRCAEALATKQRILDDLADYLRGQKSGTAVKALRMIEERHL